MFASSTHPGQQSMYMYSYTSKEHFQMSFPKN
jgi:hypothetical protein